MLNYEYPITNKAAVAAGLRKAPGIFWTHESRASIFPVNRNLLAPVDNKHLVFNP